MSTNIRPLGGLLSLSLSVASRGEATPSVETTAVEIPLLEDRSTYQECVEWNCEIPSVTHSLTLITPLDYCLPQQLIKGLSTGFVALITLQNRQQIAVGHSPQALADRALRLVSYTAYSGEKPSERGYKKWLLESTDNNITI